MPDVGGSNFLRPGNWSPANSPSTSGIRTGPLPAPVSWSRLVLRHSVALLPAVFVLVLALWSSYLALNLCDMQLLYPGLDETQCSRTMSFGVASLIIAVGAISWHTAYALRPVCWEATFWMSKWLFAVIREWMFASSLFDDSLMMFTGIASAFLRSILVEALRLLGQELGVIVVVMLAWHQNHTRMTADAAEETSCWVSIDDPRFPIALWLGAGWAAAELVAGSYQLCKFLPTFRSIEETSELDEEDLLNDFVHPESSASEDDDTNEEEELSLDEVLLVREKAELEEQLGEALENVSTATIALWRLDSVLWNLGSSLILFASLTHAQGCPGDRSLDGNVYDFLPFPSLSAMWPSLVLLVSLHTLATTVWMMALPRLGLISITYASMLVGLALLSLGLGRWDALA